MSEPVDTEALPCGCTVAKPVCERHRRLYEYAKAFRNHDRTATSALPDLVLQPTFATWWSEFDTFRKVLLALLVIGVPLTVLVLGTDPLVALALFCLLTATVAAFLPTVPNRRLVLEPRTRTVRYRNWRRKTVALRVDADMRAAAFLHVDVGVTTPAINVVLWTSRAVARLDQRLWGLRQLEDLVFVLGVPVGGIAGEKDIEAMFPGTLPPISRHPVAFGLGLVGLVFVVLIAGGVVLQLAG